MESFLIRRWRRHLSQKVEGTRSFLSLNQDLLASTGRCASGRFKVDGSVVSCSLTKASCPFALTPTLYSVKIVRCAPFSNRCPWSRVECDSDGDEAGVDPRVHDTAV